MKRLWLLSGVIILAVTGCGKQPASDIVYDSSYQETLLTELIDAQPGDTITIPEGRFAFTRSLSLTVDGVTIKGAGMDKSVLSFKGQVTGAEGLLVTANDFTIEDVAIEDTKGDGLKVNEGKNIIIRRVRTEWTGGAKTENGAYGIYPVQTENVLLEGNIAIGASDAGIYVGQSRNVIMRENIATGNVAGIEIENTIGADVYENIAKGNTGGILVFNMPNLSQPGYATRIFRNVVEKNNHKNFGHAGTPVASIPAGSGIVVNSNDQVEIFDNIVKDNKTANVIISSVYSTGYAEGDAQEDFDPYPEAIYIYNNSFEGGGNNPDGMDLQALKLAKFGPTGRLPDILWDGYQNEALLVDGNLPDDKRLCVQNGAVKILNADGPNGYKNPAVLSDGFNCAHEKLAPIELNGLGE